MRLKPVIIVYNRVWSLIRIKNFAQVFFLMVLMLYDGWLYAHEIEEGKKGHSLRVGMFSNPPLAFKGKDGHWQGISVDLLEAIAGRQGWQLEYIEAPFSEQLKKFRKHQIDLIIMMAYSDERAKKYIFTHNPIISNWGLVYARPGSGIGSLLDLQGKRVGVMRNNIHDRAFRKLVEKFSLQVDIVELDNFRDVMKSVSNKRIDAGVVNRLFGAQNARKYELVETGILFNPINIHYASYGAGHRKIIEDIDRQLSLYKKDKDSVYYRALRRWISQPAENTFPQWLIWIVAGLLFLILLMSIMTMVLRRQVSRRTFELQQEVDERREAQAQLDKLAYFDSLTQLPNRLSFLESLKVAISSARRRKNRMAILFIDVDRFKTVNDSLGHDAGDQLIVNIASRLKACIRDIDVISRFGGDEFVAMLQDVRELSDITRITRRMLASLDEPVKISATEIYSSICIGIALYPEDDSQGDQLLKYADAAMYHAKAQGGNNYKFYNEELTQRVQNRLSMETRLRQALQRDEFVLYYQPVFNLQTQRIVGVEALIRWRDPEHGLVPPDEFIPLAEETGIIVSMGEWIIDQACAQLKAWQTQGIADLQLAINVSSRQFENDSLFTTVFNTIEKYGIKASQLELEITERMFLDITEKVRKVMDKLTADGVQLSIDDFGTGYSSLSYLKQLPIATLKIDRSFISDIPEDRDDMQIASTIVSMAHGLGLDVVAEGIETHEQLSYLQSLGCDRAQGYFLAKPQPADEVLARIFHENALFDI